MLNLLLSESTPPVGGTKNIRAVKVRYVKFTQSIINPIYGRGMLAFSAVERCAALLLVLFFLQC